MSEIMINHIKVYHGCLFKHTLEFQAFQNVINCPHNQRLPSTRKQLHFDAAELQKNVYVKSLQIKKIGHVCIVFLTN